MRKADKKSSKKQSSVLEKLRKAKQIFAISMRRREIENTKRSGSESKKKQKAKAKAKKAKAKAEANKKIKKKKGRRLFPSSSGLGHRPFTAVTRVRISLGTPPAKFR